MIFIYIILYTFLFSLLNVFLMILQFVSYIIPGYNDIYEGEGSANTTPPKNVENIEFVKTASRPVWHPGGCIGASNGASTALKLPGKPEIHVFFVRLYTYAGP